MDQSGFARGMSTSPRKATALLRHREWTRSANHDRTQPAKSLLIRSIIGDREAAFAARKGPTLRVRNLLANSAHHA